ncbi:MAG: hypothetical protein ABR880_23175 [Candidatus Sulfotelmatobacter sp.]|jgi:hypothetical protein
MTRLMADRCVLCGEPIAADDADAVEVGDGLAHGDCIAERDDEGLFGDQDPESAATGRGAAFECSTAELERERRERAMRRAKDRRKAG